MDRRDFLRLGAGGAVVAAAGCVRAPDKAPDKAYSFDPHRGLRISWPGLAKPVRLRMVADTHFGLHDARDDRYADNYRRMAQWGAKKEPFEKMLASAKERKPDLLVLLGDNISFPTCANVEYLKSALDACGLPWTFVAGNHDWHFEGEEGSDFEQRDKWTKGRLAPLYQGESPLACSRVVNGVRIVMIDNSLYHVLPEQLAFWQAEIAKGDPTCLCMHIPFWQPGWSVTTCACPTWGAATDPYWQIERRQRWAEKLMPSTFAFREAVLSAPNLVGVFAGHEHVWQFARERGQNLFTVVGNGKGDYLDVTIG